MILNRCKVLAVGHAECRPAHAVSRLVAPLALALLVLMTMVLKGTAEAGPVVPSSFGVTQYAYPFSDATDMAFAPDGRLFVCQKTGQLMVVKNGTVLQTPFLTVSVDQAGERGLSGVAFDPNFASNGYVYIYYTATIPTVHNRVSRFTASTSNPDVADPNSETVILDLDTLGTSTFHNGASLKFGPDGKLYVGVGDNNTGTNASSFTSLLGKVLRINPDGTIPTNNPFVNTASGSYRAIWALGLRNPFKIAFQPGSGRLFINDVGSSYWEEINDGIAGSNYGWPTYEGYTTDPNYRSPLFAYAHGSTSTTGCAITGGAFYNPTVNQYPASFTGQYFFADYCNGWIRLYDPASGTASDFLSGVPNLVDLEIGPDGNLYYLTIRDASNNLGTGGVYKVLYSGAPQISQHPASQIVSVGYPVTFSVTASGDQPLSYQWNRNNAPIAGATASSYTINSTTMNDNGAQFTCTVSNSFGTITSNAATLTVTTNLPPTCSITQPTQGQKYNAGDTISFAGTATDPETGNLPPSAYTWWIVFHHDTHTHPFIEPFSGVTSGTFAIPTTGETSANTWYRVHLQVTDPVGLTTSSYVDILPNKANISLATNPPGLKLTLDSNPQTTPFTTTGVVGFTRTLGAPSPQALNNTVYEFVSWSDGGAQTHDISTQPIDTTYTANFAPVTTPYDALFISQNVPSHMVARGAYNVSITMQNIGTQTWTAGNKVRLGAINPYDNVTWGLNRADMPANATIAPGSTITFNFTVIAPGSAGTYNFQWQMLQEGIAWFGDQTPNVPIVVDVNAAAFVSQSVPTKMIAGLRYDASVTMRNTGTTTWTEDELYRLAAQNPQDNATWGENREFLPSGAAVAPGGTVTFSFRVEAPLTAGTYNFQWQMSEDLVQTFGQQTPNVAIVVDSLGAQFISQSVPSSMTSATTYPISITMKNVGSTTWTSGSYALGSQNLQDNTTWGSNRINLPAGTSVAPGASYTFTFNVTAPSTATGTYNFEWRMINTGVAWFGEVTPNVAVSVTGNAAISLSQTVPTSMIGGRIYPISVTMKNTGTTTWAGNHRLGTQNPQDNFIWGFNRVYLPSGITVAPGSSYTFNFNVTAPTNAGTYNMQWKMVQTAVAWYGQPTTNVPIAVSQAPVNAATYVGQSFPTTMSAGQQYTVSVTMRNTGTTTWSEANLYRLGAQNPQDNTTWGFNRALVPSGTTVAPGASCTFTFVVTAPAQKGTYNAQWRMVQDRVAWFGDFTPNVAVTVN